jgi:hypothetical protein
VTFCAHTFADIRKVRLTSSGSLIVEIAQTISKGSRLIEHLVSLEGDPNSERVTDFVFQLSSYLKRSFGLTLDANMTSSDAFVTLCRDRTPLWGYSSRDNWSCRLNIRFTMAGYPAGFFTPHSARLKNISLSRILFT